MKIDILRRGLEIIAIHEPQAEFYPGHDQIWIGNEDIELTYAEKKILKDDNWFIDEEQWSHFC